jgi:transposase
MLLIGIDQSPSKHDICIMDVKGCQLAHLSIPNSATGFQDLHAACQKFGVPPQNCLVAIESAHSLLVDYLLDHGYPVRIVPGKSVDRYRDRFRQSRSCSDTGDAEVLAHVMRTDRALYQPLVPDTPLTRQIRSQVKLVSDAKKNVVRCTNQLRDLLWRYYPIAAELFSSLDCYIALEFIQAYPTPQAADALTQADFNAFCRAHNYRRFDYIARRYAELSAAQTYASPEVAAAYASQAQALSRVVYTLVTERNAAQKALTQSFEQHPDAHIYASLPGAGEFLAPAILSKFRDHRGRFPSSSVAQAVAGTCPVTIRSGKRKRRIVFRHACDRKFRHIMTQFARCSIKKASWAAAYYYTKLASCGKKNQAYRCLANRWVAIIWRLWVDRVEYDEAVHLRNRLNNRRS